LYNYITIHDAKNILKNLGCSSHFVGNVSFYTRWFKYDREYLCVNKQFTVRVIFEPPCILYNWWHFITTLSTEGKEYCTSLFWFCWTTARLLWCFI